MPCVYTTLFSILYSLELIFDNRFNMVKSIAIHTKMNSIESFLYNNHFLALNFATHGYITCLAQFIDLNVSDNYSRL